MAYQQFKCLLSFQDLCASKPTLLVNYIVHSVIKLIFTTCSKAGSIWMLTGSHLEVNIYT